MVIFPCGVRGDEPGGKIFPKAPQSLVAVAWAAKLRMASLGCHFGCKHVSAYRLRRLLRDNIFSRHHDLRRTMVQSEHFDRIGVWRDWYKRNCCTVLVDNVNWLKSHGITASALYSRIVPGDVAWTAEDVRKVKREFQQSALKAIKLACPIRVVDRVRHKLERWRGIQYGLSGSPGRYSPQIVRRIQQLSKLVTPRVHAATFTTLWNGWCTHRRFQLRHLPTNVCMFKCGGAAEDSLEHYCRCVPCRVESCQTRVSCKLPP